MCTLLYLPWTSGPYLAAIGLNRDEVYTRPAAPPRWWHPAAGGGRETAFVAPVDLQAGGTWFGVAGTGLFAALTNGRQAFPFRHQRSRGELVPTALRLGYLAAAVEALEEADAFAYAPCHLFLAQGSQVAYGAPNGSGRFAFRLLDRSTHTLTNSGLDAGDTPPIPAGTPGDADGVPGSGDAAGQVVERVRSVLATHEGPLARCRHDDDRGTRSSAVLLLGPDLARSRLLYAEGPPCTAGYCRVTLRETPPA